MIDFSRKPTPRTEEEKLFDELSEKYAERFGVDYFFAIGDDSPTLAEAIEDIRKRIANNDPQKPPEYEPGNIY